jgi:photosystem II stability/assembly factor-like uncharacterized protein
MFKSPFFLILVVFMLIATVGGSIRAEWVQRNGLYTGSIYCFAVSGTDLLAGGVGVLRTTDNGVTWTRAGLTDTTVEALAVRGTTILAGTGNAGVLRSTNNGASWTQWNQLNWSVTSLAVVGADFFAGNGFTVFRSTDDGITWTEVNSGLPTNDAGVCFTVLGTILFTGTSGNGVFKTTNFGASWDTASNGLPMNASAQSLVSSGTSLIAGVGGCPPFSTRGMYVSSDSGASWSNVGFGFFPSAFALQGVSVFALVPGIGGSCGQPGGMYKSTDNGLNWTSVNMPSNYSNPISLFSNGTDLYSGSAQAFLPGTSFGGVFRSTDDGTSWVSASPGLSHLGISSLAQVGNNLFAGTSGGSVFQSTDDGANWRSASVGLTDPNINSLSPIGTNLFAGTSTGLFLTTNSGLSWNQTTNGIPASSYVYGVIATGGNLLASVGANPGLGGVYISTDNGSTWSQ